MRLPKLSKLELQIMEVLWTKGPAAIREIQESFGPKNRPAYTTVQTMLNVLLRKKKVRRTQEGRAYAYQAAVSRDGATMAALSDLVLISDRAYIIERANEVKKEMAAAGPPGAPGVSQPHQ